MTTKIRVFVSHSFDQLDEALINRFLEVMRRPKFHFEVRSARYSEARPFPDKIEEIIEWADLTFGIFTCKYLDPERGHVPPPYVISECSYALGYYAQSHKKVHGFVEKGVKHTQLGLNTARGNEFPEFEREEILKKEFPKGLDSYLTDIYERYSEERIVARRKPYSQRYVRKTVEVYRNGGGIFKNKVEIGITDSAEIVRQGNAVQHTLWLHNKEMLFPPFAEMLGSAVRDRRHKPFFMAMFLQRAQTTMEEPMKAELIKQTDHEISFWLKFPFKVKDSDILRYQYVWGLPSCFYAYDEELNEKGLIYQEIGLRCHHGQIKTAELRAKFERETRYGASPGIFDKEPYVVFSPASSGDGHETDAEPIRKTEKDSIFEIYEQPAKNITGSMAIRWRPISKAVLTATSSIKK